MSYFFYVSFTKKFLDFNETSTMFLWKRTFDYSTIKASWQRETKILYFAVDKENEKGLYEKATEKRSRTENDFHQIFADGLVFGIHNRGSHPLWQANDCRTHQTESVKAYVESKGAYGVGVYVLLHVLQVIIAVIPGEPIQIAGGYLFGTFFGSVLTFLGIMLGSLLAFGIARKFGVKIVKLFVNEERLLQQKQRLESRKGKAVLFVLFLLPGVPKDVLIYAVGLTPISFRKFSRSTFSHDCPPYSAPAIWAHSWGKAIIKCFSSLAQ